MKSLERSEVGEMGYKFLKVLKILVMVAVACTVFGYVTMRLWNWLMPEIFGLRVITFAQAIGLLVLSKILLGGFHKHGNHRGWKGRMEKRWDRMSPEERERLRAGMRGRWGCRPRGVDETFDKSAV
jgi:hypothetical protein